MTPKLYSLELSPPVRSVLLTAKAIGLKLDIKTLDLGEKEHLSADFLAKNPQHTVPTLEEDDGFIIWDSHAIMPYIVEKYSTNSSFYPKHLKDRAVIHQRLHFDTMSAVIRSKAINPLFHAGATEIPEELVRAMEEHYSFLEKFLDGSEWIAGNTITIADFSLIPSITTSDIVVPVDQNIYPKLWNWMRRAENWEFYDENRRGHEALKALILDRLQK